MITKGWTTPMLAQQWGLSERQTRRIVACPKQRDLDALKGLPAQLSDQSINESKDFLLNSKIGAVEFIYRIHQADQQLEIRQSTLPKHKYDGCPHEYLTHTLRLGHHLLLMQNKANDLSLMHNKTLTFNELFLRHNTINTAEYEQKHVCEGWTSLNVEFHFDVTYHRYECFPYNPFEVAELAAHGNPTWFTVAVAMDVMCLYSQRHNLPSPLAIGREMAPDIFLHKVRQLGNFHNLSFPPSPQELIDELAKALAHSIQGFHSRSEAYIASRPRNLKLDAHIHDLLITGEYLTDLPTNLFPRVD